MKNQSINKHFLNALLLLVLLLGVNTEVWGETYTQSLANTDTKTWNDGKISLTFSDVSKNGNGYDLSNKIASWLASSSEKDFHQGTMTWTSLHAGYSIKVTKVIAGFKTDVSYKAYGIYGRVYSGGESSYTNKMYTRGSYGTDNATIENNSGLGTSIYFTTGHNSVGGETYLNNITVTYIRTANTFTLSYDANEGTVTPASKTVTYDATYGELPTPTRTGYAFTGWYTAKSGGTAVTSSTTVSTASNHTIYAHWTANTYSVVFNGNGNTGGSMSNESFTYDAAAKALTANAYTRAYTVTYAPDGGTTASTTSANTTASYSFKNWNTQADGSGTTYTNGQNVRNLTSVANGSFNLYAQWNSGSVTLPNATKENHVIEGWYNGSVDVPANKVGVPGDSYTPTADVTLTAKWIAQYPFTMSGSDRTMNVGDEISPAFTFTYAENPTAHIDITSISSVKNGNAVVEYDAVNNKLIARNAGVATIYFTQANTETILPGTSDTWTIRVNKIANTLSRTVATHEMYVDDELSGIINENVAVSGQNNTDVAVAVTTADEDLIRYVEDNDKIIVPNSGNESFKTKVVDVVFSQPETYKYTAASETIAVTVKKYQTSIATPTNYTKKVNDEFVITSYSPTNVSQTTPDSGATDHNFYYTIAHTLPIDKNVNGSAHPYEVIGYNPSNHTITAHNAGSAILTIAQKETYKFIGDTITFNVTVSKYTPTFKWNSGSAYYYQSTIPSIFSTNGPNAYTIVSDNEASAKVVDNTLHIYNVEETANITVTQEENYLWAGKEETYVVTPVELNNHVEFNITSENINIFKYGTSSNASLDGNGYKLGDGGLDNTACEYSIQFTGIPEYLSFDKHMDNYLGQLPVGSESVVYESADGTNWIEVWKNTERKADVNGTNILLKPTTRYLKFYYNGSIYCYYQNIHVTELNQFSAAPAMVDFGTKGANYGTQEENVTFNHANAGRVTTMEIVGDDAEYFSIERSSIPGTGRDLYSTFTIAVRFDNKGEVRGEDPYVAVLHIVDNKDHILNIPLTGIRNGKTAPEFSFNPNHLPYFVGTNIANVASSTNTDYANCPLTFETSDASVAQVIDGTLHIYNKKQPVTITIRQGENEDYAEGTATFTFTPRERPDRSVPMQLVKTIYNEGTVEAGNKCAWEDSENGVRVGNTNVVVDDLIWEHAEKNFTIAFDGQPGRLSFEYKSAGGIWVVTGGETFGFHMWEVKESSDGNSWNSVWTAEEAQKEWTSVNEIPLSPTTRYIRFSFSGNYWGYFRNINISELVGYKYLRAEADGRYLSRGAKWGTQAIVDDFGMACRISNYTNDNTNFYTRFLFVDNQQYLYEADNHEMYTDDGTAANNYNLWKQNVIDGTILTFQSGNEYPGDSRKGQYITLDGDALALTADAAAATRWKMEDYTEHPAHILEILNREAAEAASHDFATDVTTLEKVRSRVEENDFERTDITIPALTLGEQSGEYRSGVAGTNVIYDNEISDLQPGFYRLTVKAFSRISSADVAWACHTAGTGMESVLAYIYANDVKYPIQSLYHSYQVSPLEPTDELRGGYYYSTDLTSAGEAFDDAKRYLNDVYVYIEADPGKTTGTLRYGIKNPSYVPGAWLAFEEITLTRFARKEYIFNGESATGETTDWQMGGNWNRNTQPDYRHVVSVQHDLVIDEEVSVYSLVIENDKDGNPVTVTIAPTGGLTVGAGGVKNATRDNFILQAGTTGATKGQTGYLRVSPYTREPMPEATVQLFSIGYYDKSAEDTDEDNVAAWQYVGTPIDFKGALAKTAFTRSWIYSYDQTSDSWVNNRKNLVMQPFVGYATTQYDSEEGKLIEYKGTLQPNGGVQTINLAYTDDEHGYNVVANSFAAPIDITKMRKEDFIHVEDPTIYLFHTGTRQQAEENSGAEGNNAGQFISIAIGTAAEMGALFADDDIPTVIAPMQGFGIYASEDGGQIRLDYTKLVWNANYAAHPNKPLRVAQIHEEGADSIDRAEITGALKMTISAEGRSDKCYLIESDRYDSFYEAGYDASKKMSGRLNIFTVADDDKLLAVNATNSIDGTRIGVRTGEETAYTLLFTHLSSEEELALLDIETNQTIDINEGTEYTFFAEPNTVIPDRFRIVERNNAPAITTDVDNVSGETKVHKFIKNDQMYILKDGVLYNASGAVVRR